MAREYRDSEVPSSKCVKCTIVEKKHILNPESTILYQVHDQKALFKVPKICNINFWIGNAPPFGTFPKIHPIW